MKAKIWSTYSWVISRPWLPNMVRNGIERSYVSLAERRFARQAESVVLVSGIPISIPARHPLPQILETEPFREHLLRAAASIAFTDERTDFVDVGANVGDTAILVAQTAKTMVRMTLVEPSPVFLPFLHRNIRDFDNAHVVDRFAAISHPPREIPGRLRHWGGTALVIDSDPGLISSDEQVDLAELVTESTALVKIDCDGMDLAVLAASIDRFPPTLPMVVFENTISTLDDFELLKHVVDMAGHRGYGLAVVSHYCGALLYSGGFDEGMWDIFRFQLNMIAQERSVVCYYTDVLFVNAAEKLQLDAVVQLMRTWQEPRHRNPVEKS